jgi:addiction module HigA family antidote
MMPTHRPPTSPGEMLLEEFLKPMGLTQTELAERMGVPVQAVNLLVRGRREVTARMALLLSEVLGTSAEVWLNLQMRLNLWNAMQERAQETAPERAKAAARQHHAAASLAMARVAGGKREAARRETPRRSSAR